MSSWSVMEAILCRIGRDHRGLRGDHSDGRRNGPNPEQSGGPKRSGGWRRPAILLRDAKRARQMANVSSRRRRAAENSRTQPLPVRAACRPIAL
jgi:hypothetical protein